MQSSTLISAVIRHDFCTLFLALKMERILRNPVLLLYLFKGGAPTFIKAEKF
jgi:hypothetical protein